LIELERREASKLLNVHVTSLAELCNVRCHVEVTTGEAFDGIIRTARSSSADLIVMGSHREQLLRDVFLGTTIERVIRTAPYPVQMVNREAERPYGRVLAAVDMSGPSAHMPRTQSILRFSNGGGSVDKHGLHSQTLASLTREFGNDLNSSSTAMTHYA
jgi:universal stress protein E